MKKTVSFLFENKTLWENTQEGGKYMGYILTFMGGAAFGVVLMCIFQVSGQESRREEEYLKQQNQGE